MSILKKRTSPKTLGIVIKAGLTIVLARVASIFAFALFIDESQWTLLKIWNSLPSIIFNINDFDKFSQLNTYSLFATVSVVFIIFIYKFAKYRKTEFAQVVGWYMGVLMTQTMIISTFLPSSIISQINFTTDYIFLSQITFIFTIFATMIYIWTLLFEKRIVVVNNEQYFDWNSYERARTQGQPSHQNQAEENQKAEEIKEEKIEQEKPKEAPKPKPKTYIPEVITSTTMGSAEPKRTSLFEQIREKRKLNSHNIFHRKHRNIKISGLKGDSVLDILESNNQK